MARTNSSYEVEGGKEASTVTVVEKTAENPFKAEPKKGLVRFWSEIQSHRVAVSAGRNVVFKNHILELAENDPDVAAIRKVVGPFIKEIIDKPFEKEDELARFNEFLNKRMFTGENGLPSKRGLSMIKNILSREDDTDDIYSKSKANVPNLVVMRVLKTKSFREGI